MKERSFFSLTAVAFLSLQSMLAPAALAQGQDFNQGLPAYSPANSVPGMSSGATAGTLTAAPTGGFAGLKSRSGGINPASLPTSAADPRMQQMLGLVPKFTPDFMTHMAATNLPTGTVLTGILEQTVSSKKSKPGDVFSIRLEDGFSANGIEIIPKQSKILGSVSAVLSSHSRHGAHPGTVNVSLQTLIFPDGRTIAFWGFIEHNPLQDNTNQSGSHIKSKAAGYGRMATFGTINQVTKRVGYNLRPPNFGKEMVLQEGEVLPIKTNRPIDLTKMNAAIQQSAMPPGSVNGMYQSGNFPPGMAQASPNSVPGLPPYTPAPSNYAAPMGAVPGLSGAYASPSMAGSSAAPAYVPPAGSGQPNIPYPSEMEPF